LSCNGRGVGLLRFCIIYDRPRNNFRKSRSTVLFHVVVVAAAAAAAADDDDDEDMTSQSSDRPGVTSTKSRPSSPINRLNHTASLIGLLLIFNQGRRSLWDREDTSPNIWTGGTSSRMSPQYF